MPVVPWSIARIMRGRYSACEDAGMAHLAAFFGVAIVVIVTPGQDTALTIRNTLAGGARSGVYTALGVATGQAVWTLCTSLGLAALLLASEPAFVALKLAGAAYLVWLGIHSLVDAVRGAGAVRVQAGAPRPATAYRRGFLSNLGNPKVALFFTSLLPQFAPQPGVVPAPVRARAPVLRHDAPVALRLCRRRRATRRHPAPVARTAGTRCDHRNRARRIRHPARGRALASVDRLRERVAHALELARVSVQLVRACAALGEDLPHEHEAASLQQ